MLKKILLPILVFSCFIINAQGTEKPISISGSKELIAYDKMIAPYVIKARKKLNKIRKAFHKELETKKGDTYYMVIRLYDPDGKYEQVYMKITAWDGDRLIGYITNTPRTITSSRKDQKIEFKEESILDFLIRYKNGREKGNYVGDFLKTLQ